MFHLLAYLHRFQNEEIELTGLPLNRVVSNCWLLEVWMRREPHNFLNHVISSLGASQKGRVLLLFLIRTLEFLSLSVLPGYNLCQRTQSNRYVRWKFYSFSKGKYCGSLSEHDHKHFSIVDSEITLCNWTARLDEINILSCHYNLRDISHVCIPHLMWLLWIM